jgi:hypothetical protein
MLASHRAPSYGQPTPIRRLDMPTDPAWLLADSYRLMERTEELNRASREQVVKSRRIIAESRRIMAAIT